eukprot:4471946-Pleurochrysis_carterae.AAC.2
MRQLTPARCAPRRPSRPGAWRPRWWKNARDKLVCRRARMTEVQVHVGWRPRLREGLRECVKHARTESLVEDRGR